MIPRYLIVVLAVAAVLPAGALAQQDRPAYVRALAAGYTASFVCSNLFNGGLSEAQTEADDLKGTYDNLTPLFGELLARVDRDGRTVSVAYDPDMPPRLAAWRPVLGCTTLPIGATAEVVAVLPRIQARAPNLDGRRWPTGDRDAIGRASGDVRALNAAVARSFDRRSYGQGSETTAIVVVHEASGLNSDHAGNRTDALYFGGVGVADQAAGWPLVAAPGKTFRYANNDTVLAIRGLQHALGDGDKSLRFPFEALLWKIGMTRTVPETDWRGHFIMSSQVWTTARDLARLGLLHLNDGMWDKQRVLPANWREYVRQHGPAQPRGGYGYGASWWTFPKDSGLPQDAIVARGNRGQYVVVLPSRKLVIVRRGFDGNGMNFDLDAFTRDVLSALK